MLDGVNEQPIPDGTELDRLTVPVKPPSGATVTFDKPEDPAKTITVVGFADTLKSVMFKTKLKPYPVLPEFPCPETAFEDTVQEDPGFNVRVLEEDPCAGSEMMAGLKL